MIARKQYDRKPTQVWLDPITGEKTNTRVNDNQIKFDSHAEYMLYIKLIPMKSAFKFDLYKDCPLYLDKVKWLVDFKLVFDDIEFVEYFLYNMGQRIENIELPVLYVEYKGLLNPQAIAKLDLLEGNSKNSQILILSDKPAAYMKENFHTYSTFIKPIYSVDFFVTMLYNLLLAYSRDKDNERQ